jgi:CubicO group peptidase (beta-lactamase class C family)
MSNIKKFELTPLIIFFSLFLAGAKSSFTQSKVEKIDELLKIYHEYGQFNGTVLVAEKGKVIYKKGFGMANMEWNVPNETDAKFRIGSNTKQFTATLIMILVQEGKIKLDDKITDYLPEYRNDTGDKITIHNLLTHTSGITDYANSPGFFPDSARHRYSRDYLIMNHCSGDLEFVPGTKFSYSSSGYILLGEIIEKVTGMSYEDALHEKICKPLQMFNTGVDNDKIILEKRAYGYMKENFKYIKEYYYYIPNTYAAGDIYSTVEDLYLWDQALYSEKLLSDKSKKLMFNAHILTSGLPTYGASYGYGWLISKILLPSSNDSLVMVWHQGYIAGFHSMISRILNDKHLIVILNNTGHTKLWEMNSAIFNILYGYPYEVPKKSIYETLAIITAEKDIDYVINLYHDLKKNHYDMYDFNESELNSLGYYLFISKRVDEAIEIFELNVEVYPMYADGWDSLGEAYTAAGKNELAIKSYQKVLELNPDNKNADEMLKKLNEKVK